MGSSPRRLSQGLRPSAGGTCRRGTVSRRPIALFRFRHVVVVPCCAYVVDWGSLAVAVRELGRALPASRRKAAAVRAGAPHTRLQCFTMRQTVAWTTIQRGVGRSGVAGCGSLPCLWMSGCPAMCGRYVGSCLPRLPEFRLVCSSCATVCSPFPARSAIFLLDAHVRGSLVALSGGGVADLSTHLSNLRCASSSAHLAPGAHATAWRSGRSPHWRLGFPPPGVSRQGH